MKTTYYKLRAFGVKWVMRLMPRNQPLVYTGLGSSKAMCRQISLLGYAPVLLVSDEILNKFGVLDGIKQTLDEMGLEYHTYLGIKADPEFEQVVEGEAMLRSTGCKAILAVGGGSVLDAAKVISLLNTNPGDLASFDGIMKSKHRGLPLFVAPTTAGTGSEITPAAVISDSKTHRKVVVADGKTVPDFVALDAELMTSMPPSVTAATGMDALTHAVESYLSRASTPITQAQARAAVTLIFEYLPKAWHGGDDVRARDAMATASFFAGNAFGRTAVGYVHGIAHQLGRICGTPHGVANAMNLPEVLTAYGPCVHAPLAELARAVGVDPAGGSDAELANRFIQLIADLRQELQLPTSPEGLSPNDVDDVVKEALAEAGSLYPVPRYLSAGELKPIVEKLVAAG